MTLPEKVQAKYLDRFDALIQEGTLVADSIKTETHGGSSLSMDVTSCDENAFYEWRSKCTTLLENLTRQGSVHTAWVDRFSKIDVDDLTEARAHLRAMKQDFQDGFLENLLLEIEAEIAGDYMTQAERLLGEGLHGKFDHVPAAVLAGAVLEKSLRTLCEQHESSIETVDKNGARFTLNRLIDELKKVDAYNEPMAKQLRAWADIRNDAAHGDFEKFDSGQVKRMIEGINDFLAKHLG